MAADYAQLSERFCTTAPCRAAILEQASHVAGKILSPQEQLPVSDGAEMIDARAAATASFQEKPRVSGRIVVISPHFDDAVLSLGATIASAVDSGAQVEVLTVFGCGPHSTAAAETWDRKSGFTSEAHAARERRAEDAAACRILGATPRWCDFGAEPYERHATPEQIVAAVREAAAGADCALVPGFPLAHRDHLELTQLVLGAGLSCRIGLYAEQPYLYYERKTIDPAMRAPALSSLVAGPLDWTRVRTERRERRLKIRAVRSYRSQLRQLGLAHIGLYRMLWHEASLGGEAIAWLS